MVFGQSKKGNFGNGCPNSIEIGGALVNGYDGVLIGELP